MRVKRLLPAILITMLLLIVVSIPVLAAWEFMFPIYAVDSSSTNRTYVQVLTGIEGSSLVDSGYISATGTDTDMQIGGTSVPFMLCESEITTVAPVLNAGGRVTWNMYLGYSPAQSSFQMITGTSGSITTSDSSAIELGDTFEVYIVGYVDVSSGSDKNLAIKDSAFKIWVSDTGEISASIYSGGGWTAHAVTATGLSSEEHIVRVVADVTNMYLYIDGELKDTDVLSGASVADNGNEWVWGQNNVLPYIEQIKIWVD